MDNLVGHIHPPVTHTLHRRLYTGLSTGHLSGIFVSGLAQRHAVSTLDTLKHCAANSSRLACRYRGDAFSFPTFLEVIYADIRYEA